MGESACLMHTFSYASSAMSNEAKQGNPIHGLGLGESISFGRFMSESLSWEKWSTFSHNRYVEEAERYAKPGSVAQKKAFFEAHYKRIAAKKAAALLEQSSNTDPEPEFEGGQIWDIDTEDAHSITTNSQVPVGDELEMKMSGTEVKSIFKVNDYNASGEVEEMETTRKVKGAHLETEHEIALENHMESESLNQIENVENQNMVSEMGLGESAQMEKLLLEGSKSSLEPPPLPVSKKKPASTKSSVCRRASKVPASPAISTASIHPRKDNIVTTITRMSPIDSVEKKRTTSKSLHMLIYSTPAKEPDKSTTPAGQKADSSRRVAPSSYKTSIDSKTPMRTPPIMTYTNGALKKPSTTPCSENKRPKTPLDPLASGCKTTGPNPHSIHAVCSKSLSTCRNTLQSPTVSAPFSLRTEERAARRKQKLEEKFNAKDKETQKVQLQTRLKKKAETELTKLRQSFCFKARPLPDFYKERETPKNQIKKNVKTPLTRPQSPKLGRKPSSSTLQGINSLPSKTQSTKKNGPKNVLKKKGQIQNPLTSVPEKISHENTCPNIQLDQQKQECT